jgi:endoglucanase
VEAAAAAGAVAVLVAYDIPNRDCGGFSGGGAVDADAYRAWIAAFAEGLDGRRAVVVLEPDALAGMDCLDAAGRTERVDLLSFAVVALAGAGALVYVDVGHPAWIDAAEMATRLHEVGVEHAAGFAVNVSNFNTDEQCVEYGTEISRSLGGDVHFVVDSSRNGLGPAADGEWCNPPDRALGRDPTTRAPQPLVDAFLWIKRPGESDGTCNGGPPAGQWWPEYALGLVLRRSRDTGSGP